MAVKVAKDDSTEAQLWVRPLVVNREIADLNPPPTEGLLWPRFDFLTQAD